MADNLTAKSTQAKSVTKADIADFVKKTYFDEKLIYIKRNVTLN